MVSATAMAGTTASAPARTAVTTRAKRAGEARGRAPSCTRTTVTVPSSGIAARPARTDAERVAPPTTTRSAPGSGSSRKDSPTTSTTPALTVRAAASAWSSTRPSPSRRYCLGTSPPKRDPDPPATTMVQTSRPQAVTSGQGFVELLLGVGLAHVDGEGQLGDEDLAGLGQHALLAGG